MSAAVFLQLFSSPSLFTTRSSSSIGERFLLTIGLLSVLTFGVLPRIDSEEGTVTHVVAGGSLVRSGEVGLHSGGGGVGAGVREGVVEVGVGASGGSSGMVVWRT